MRKHRKKPSRTRRHRESVAAKRRARAFYRARNKHETETRTSAYRRMLVTVLFAMAAATAIMSAVAWVLS